MKPGLAALASMVMVVSCSSPTNQEPTRPESANGVAPNILLVIADDIGVEQISCYNDSGQTAVTPNIDRLCNTGLKFTSAWSNPVCTPTRTGILTGRYGFRTGSLVPTGPLTKTTQYDDTPKMLPNSAIIKHAYDNGLTNFEDDAPFLRIVRGEKFKIDFGKGPRLDEASLAKVLKQQAGYDTAAIGKWHMADQDNGDLNHPNLAGFDHYIGPMFGGVKNYYKYEKWENGVSKGLSNTYATTDTVNDALDWLRERDTDKPWFMWLAFNAPHDPFHKPPNQLISAQSQKLDVDGITPGNADQYYKAMIEAMDAEIGRLLNEMDTATTDNTIVIFLGDNGTPVGLVGAPYPDSILGKGTVFEGGVNVPFIVNGADVKPGKTSMPIHTTDVYATILSIAGVEKTDVKTDKVIDSRAIMTANRVPNENLSNIVYTEIKGIIPTGQEDKKALRNEKYKLIVDVKNDRESFFNLEADPYEQTPLKLEDLTLEARENLQSLRLELDNILAK